MATSEVLGLGRVGRSRLGVSQPMAGTPKNSASDFRFLRWLTLLRRKLKAWFSLGLMDLFVANFGLLISDVCVCCIVFGGFLPDIFWVFFSVNKKKNRPKAIRASIIKKPGCLGRWLNSYPVLWRIYDKPLQGSLLNNQFFCCETQAAWRKVALSKRLRWFRPSWREMKALGFFCVFGR